jgi:hypothetical protein
MPLSKPVAREPIHKRTVTCTGYLREDGLWDIEGNLVDQKTYAFPNESRGEVPPGEPVHGMWIRMTVDESLTIRDMEAVTDYGPFAICPAITPNFKRMIGVQIGKGFRREIKQRVGGTEGCTHLVEMLGPLATTAFQSVFPYQEKRRRENPEIAKKEGPRERPRILDTCHALASDGEVVKNHWPEFYEGPDAGNAG